MGQEKTFFFISSALLLTSIYIPYLLFLNSNLKYKEITTFIRRSFVCKRGRALNRFFYNFGEMTKIEKNIIILAYKLLLNNQKKFQEKTLKTFIGYMLSTLKNIQRIFKDVKNLEVLLNDLFEGPFEDVVSDIQYSLGVLNDRY